MLGLGLGWRGCWGPITIFWEVVQANLRLVNLPLPWGFPFLGGGHPSDSLQEALPKALFPPRLYYAHRRKHPLTLINL